MVEFRNSADFEKWLEALPPNHFRAALLVISLRAAVRVLPINMQLDKPFYGKSPLASLSQQLSLASFRALSIALAISLAPKGESGSFAAGAAAAAKSAYLVASAARADGREDSGIEAVYAAAVRVDAEAAVPDRFPDVALRIALRSANLTAAALSADATELEADWSKAADALTRPLWPMGQPEWAKKATAHFLETLQNAGDDWDVWARWYQDRLDGVPPDPDFILAIARIPEADWDKGPAHVNAIIKRLEEARKRPNEAGKAFFISYASVDEAKAREIAEILDEAGHSTFAMFKDIPPGANFVTEMQRGLMATLADKGRVVALYSPAYVASDHCQAEWNTAYAADPSGAKRTLLPFIVHPTELLPLARQVANRSLVGLNRAETKVAVLEAIKPAAPPKSVEEIKRVLAATATPQPTLDAEHRLDIKPNPVIDQPDSTHDLAELPGHQLYMIDLVLENLPANTPPIIRNGLARYKCILSERGLGVRPTLLSVIIVGIEKEYRSTGLEYWGTALEHWFETIFQYHDRIKTHFPLKDEQEFAEIEIKEEEAIGSAITEPINAVRDAAKELASANGITERAEKVLIERAETAQDIAYLPPDKLASQPGSTRISVKRRYVLATLGMLVAFYNFVGSTASIVSTPAGAKFFAALGTAIEQLMKLLL